jgi:hypothetical protein
LAAAEAREKAATATTYAPSREAQGRQYAEAVRARRTPLDKHRWAIQKGHHMLALALPYLPAAQAVELLQAPDSSLAAHALSLVHPRAAATLVRPLLENGPAETVRGVLRELPASFVGCVYAELGPGDTAAALADVRPLCPVANQAKVAWERVSQVTPAASIGSAEGAPRTGRMNLQARRLGRECQSAETRGMRQRCHEYGLGRLVGLSPA